MFLRSGVNSGLLDTMKTRSFLLTAFVAFFVSSGFMACAAEKADAETQLQELITKIRTDLQDGKTTAAALADRLKEFDLLIEEHKAEKTDAVAQILLAKASLYLQVFNDPETGLKLIRQLKSDFPETAQGKNADQMIGGIETELAAQKIQENMVVGAMFPDFNEKDLDGNPLSVAGYKGKVVLIDFWATWCGPCISELPNVLATYEEYHDKGFDILGISLDNEEEALKSFIEKRKMPWKQFFDGKGWGNKLAGQYGIRSIPATFLVGKDGKIVAKNLRGPALKAEVAKLLDK